MESPHSRVSNDKEQYEERPVDVTAASIDQAVSHLSGRTIAGFAHCTGFRSIGSALGKALEIRSLSVQLAKLYSKRSPIL